MFAEDFSPVVQWIECQIPVLMMGVRIPSGEHKIIRAVRLCTALIILL